jgi:SAM-dependent methyltransferase
MTDPHRPPNEDGTWHNNEAFWRECYPYLFPRQRFDVASDQVHQVMGLLGLAHGHVLDLCCGPGRHAVALAQRGLQVTAVDSSSFLLDKARQRATEAAVEIDFVAADMRCYMNPKAFDCVLNMYSSFGYFDDAADDLVVLRNIYESLKPGGSCLLDMVNKSWLSNFVEPTHSSQEPDGTLLVQRYELLDNNTRQSIEWRLIRDGQEHIFKFYIRIFSGEELRDLLHVAGFGSVALYGDLRGKRYGRRTERLIAVGHKAGV